MSSITYYCPNCWREIRADTRVCPDCHTRMDKRAQDSFVEKLIGALNHPVAAKAAFAARVLGERRETRAVKSLLSALETCGEPELQEAAIRALGEIGDTRAVQLLIQTLNDERSYLTARVAAVEALFEIGSPDAIYALQEASHSRYHAIMRASSRALELVERARIQEDG